MYVYENHLGGIYLSDELIPVEYLYCDSCGDSDLMLGEANTFEELLELLTEEDEDEGHWLPYSMEYLEEFREELEHEQTSQRIRRTD